MAIKLAFAIGSYRLHDFIKLGILQIQKLSPESAILISDDLSPESGIIKATADELGCAYKGSKTRRGHFAADFASIINALAFAEAAGADVAVKVSQRFVFRKPESIGIIQKTFENPNIMVATPGRPRVIPGAGRATAGFGAFSILSDIVMIRVGCMTPQELLFMYRERIMRESTPWKTFIEGTVDELHSSKFPGRTAKIEELTNPTADPIYLRRYQAKEQQYRELAMKHGLNGRYHLGEWNGIEGSNYLCRPLVI